MAKITIQTPPNNKVLPRFGDKSASRTRVESEGTSQVLLKNKLLLTKELNSLLYALFDKNRQVNASLTDLKQELPSVSFEAVKEDFLERIGQSNYQSVRAKDEVAAQKLLDNLFNESSREYKARFRQKQINGLIMSSKEMEVAVDNYEKSHHENLKTDLEILELQRFYLCKLCQSISSAKRFRKLKCKCGKMLEKTDDTKEITITQLNDRLAEFIEKNMWLEYGVEQLFDDMGYQTECGYYVLGRSGVKHELDVLAERDNDKVICECKTSVPVTNDVAILYGKMTDIGVFRGFIFTTALNISDDVVRYANSLGIKVITAILENKVDLKQLIASK